MLGCAALMPATTRSLRAKTPPASEAPPARSNAFLALVPSVKRELDENLQAFFAERKRIVAPYGAEAEAMVSALAELCGSGGKRLRPALVVVGFRAADARADLAPALAAGLALELLHTYLLVHDDWMDGDSLRRGSPTVHTALARRFKSERRGAVGAILAGDFAAGLATEALARVRLPAERAAQVLACFAAMQHDATLGQCLDVLGRSYDPELAYALKTGSYTVRGPLRMGALLGRAREPVLNALDAFATPVGVAFQLADDLLSAFGESAETGKALGNDLRAGKRTSLLLAGLRRAKGADARALRAVVGNAGASEAEVRSALRVLEACGARAAIEARIEALVATALGALDAGMTRTGRELLEGAALALSARRY